MKTSLVAGLAAVVLLSAAPAAAPVHATTAVLRCQSSDGTAIYTDTGCSAFQARDVPLPADLLNRIAHDAPDADAGTGLPVDPTAVAVRHSPVGSCARTPTQLAMDLRASLAAGDVLEVHVNRIAHDAPDADAGTALPADRATVDPALAAVRHSPVGTCARTPTQLAMDLRASLAAGDVNRVAESYDWAGLSSKQGERTLDRLQHLTGNNVRDSHYFDAQIGSSGGTLLASSTAGASADAGILQVVLQGEDHATALDFDVHRVDGCYFVSF